MKDLPEWVGEIIQDCTSKHSEDIPAGIAEAFTRVKAHDRFQEVVDALLRNCVQELIYDCRHTHNLEIKKETGYYTTKPKVAGTSQEVSRAYQSVYLYFMAGKTLGEITGEELSGIAEHEDALSKGHQFNAALARWLETQVPVGSKVKEAVPEKRLRLNFDRIYQQVNQAS